MTSFDTVTEIDEIKMKGKKLVDMNIAERLLYKTILFVGKMFGLRGGQEYHSRTICQEMGLNIHKKILVSAMLVYH